MPITYGASRSEADSIAFSSSARGSADGAVFPAPACDVGVETVNAGGPLPQWTY